MVGIYGARPTWTTMYDDRAQQLEIEHRIELMRTQSMYTEAAYRSRIGPKKKSQEDIIAEKVIAAIDAKYGHLLSKPDLNQIIKDTKCDN